MKGLNRWMETQGRSDRVFATSALSVAIASAALAGLAPRTVSMATVFLFAGPHHWMEARYLMSRLPGRLGPLRGYFGLGLAGVVVLVAGFALLPGLGNLAGWQASWWAIALAVWESVLVLWILALIAVRSRQKPMRDWSAAWPVGLVAIALAWVAPAWWGLALVYGHPIIALVILDRELWRTQRCWRPGYRLGLLAVPILLALLAFGLFGKPELSGDDPITQRITRHAGAGLISGVSSHALVATHTFLEMLHYGVWIVAIPLASFRDAPWCVSRLPMARRSPNWQAIFSALLFALGTSVLLLWVAFVADYATTRDVYFTLAMVHVLAEIPFLLRML